MNIVSIIILTCAGIAGGLHVLIAYMEMFAWEGDLARSVFGGTAEEARPFAFYAYNQGIYNAMLAVETCAGIALVIAGLSTIGYVLILAGTLSMMVAATGLALKDSQYLTAALKQATPAAITVLCMTFGFAAHLL